jgi:hypothetical protein
VKSRVDKITEARAKARAEARAKAEAEAKKKREELGGASLDFHDPKGWEFVSNSVVDEEEEDGIVENEDNPRFEEHFFTFHDDSDEWQDWKEDEFGLGEPSERDTVLKWTKRFVAFCKDQKEHEDPHFIRDGWKRE